MLCPRKKNLENLCCNWLSFSRLPRPPVLQGLTEMHSPYLEELLAALFSVTMETSSRLPATGPISVVSTLLLQDKEEPPVPKEMESCRWGGNGICLSPPHT